MRTHAAFLRGINLGRHQRLSMAELRAITTGLGFTDVATHVQSGNVVFGQPDAQAADLVTRLEQAIADHGGPRPRVVVRTRSELREVLVHHPFPEETDPKRVHVVLRARPIDDQEADAVAAAVERARAKGSPDRVSVGTDVLYLHTPEGVGRSILAAELARSAAAAPDAPETVATMRNWATITRVMEMLEE